MSPFITMLASAAQVLGGALVAPASDRGLTVGPGGRAFLDVAPLIINAAVEEAFPGRELYQPQLLLNLDALVILGSQAMEEDLAPEEVGKALGRPFRSVSPGSSVHCEGPKPPDTIHRCWTPEDGLYVEINGLLTGPGVYETILTLKWTIRSSDDRPSVVFQTMRAWFRRTQNGWIKEKREVIYDGVY